MKKTMLMLAVMAAMMMSLQSCDYNQLVSKQENVNAAWSEVENQYQRRMDLIPQIIGEIQGATANEQAQINAVANARASMGGKVELNIDDLDEESMEEFQRQQDAIGHGIGRIMAIAEAYPEIKTNQNFLSLQDQLEGTQNRCTNARRLFNEAAQDYNTAIRKFPTVIYAGWFGFKQKPYFKAMAGAEYSPEVKF